jgi:hypothetical protein
MSEAVPPTELLPIFNPANYPGSQPSGIGGGGGAGSFLNFPTAQGVENFSSGITFGDGTYTNSAYPPLEVDETANSYNQIYWPFWPQGGGSTWSEKNNGLYAGYAWFVCYAGSMTSPGFAYNSYTVGYCLDQYAGGTGPNSPGANVGVYLMVSNYPRAPFPSSNSNAYDVLCAAFSQYDANGFLYVDCSVDGKFVAVTDSLGYYPMIVSNNYGNTTVSATQYTPPAGSVFYPQGLKVNNTGQYVVSAILTSNNSSAVADGYGTINVYQSSDYGKSQQVILTIDGVMDYFYTQAGTNFQPMKNVYSGIAQSKNSRVICVPYTLYAADNVFANKNAVQLNAYISTDYGRTWELREQIYWYGDYLNGWPITQCTAMSASGQYIYIGGMKNDSATSSIVGGFLVYSADYGKTWQIAQKVSIGNPSTFSDVLSEINFCACTASGLGVLAGTSVNDGTNAPIVVSQQGGKAMNQFISGSPEKFWNVFMNGTGQTIAGTVAGQNAGYPSGGASKGLPIVNNYGL